MFSTHRVRLARLAGACAVVAGCSTHPTGAATVSATPVLPHSTTAVAPRLEESVAQGGPGTTVSLTVFDCLPSHGKPDQITWQSVAQAGSPTRAISGVERTGDVLHATFTVLSTDAAGEGIFDATCGSPTLHALASFTVLPL